uniref:Uncharacterized protein n=1 Tax=Sphaerodactylus townsendi TaxID=933632 RepID=A0ACB8FCR2_9SAUR
MRGAKARETWNCPLRMPLGIGAPAPRRVVARLPKMTAVVGVGEPGPAAVAGSASTTCSSQGLGGGLARARAYLVQAVRAAGKCDAVFKGFSDCVLKMGNNIAGYQQDLDDKRNLETICK